MRVLYRGISDFKKGYHTRTNVVKDEKEIWLETPSVFWLVQEPFLPAIECKWG